QHWDFSLSPPNISQKALKKGEMSSSMSSGFSAALRQWSCQGPQRASDHGSNQASSCSTTKNKPTTRGHCHFISFASESPKGTHKHVWPTSSTAPRSIGVSIQREKPLSPKDFGPVRFSIEAKM